jgi:hypothetical protein
MAETMPLTRSCKPSKALGKEHCPSSAQRLWQRELFSFPSFQLRFSCSTAKASTKASGKVGGVVALYAGAVTSVGHLTLPHRSSHNGERG